MKELAKKFRGLCTFLVTPTTDKGERVDEGRLRDLIDQQIEAGVDSLKLFGSSGAVGSFSEEERKRLMSVAVRHVAGRVPLIAGTSAITTAQAVDLSKHAADQGADAVMIVPITYWPLRDDEILAHYESIARAVPGLPVGIYNNPATTGTDIKPEVIAKLAKIDNIAFLKEGSGDPGRITTIRSLTGGSLAIYLAKDTLVPEGFAAGADGWATGAPNYLPREAVELTRLALRKRDYTELLKRFEEIHPIYATQYVWGTVRVLHTALELLGNSMGAPRPPLRMLNAQERDTLAGLLQRFKERATTTS